jgi:polyisoprenoid-binding protein YceI
MTTTIETRQTLAPGTWTSDAAHSRVGFAVGYLVGTFHGSFSPFDATLQVDEDGSARLSGVARVENVRVEDEDMTAHLQSPDFFDVERHPELGFDSSEIVRNGDEIIINGDLTIRGVTKPVELKGRIADGITDPYGRERVGLTLETTVDRTEFGLNWNAPLPGGDFALSNSVALKADLYFFKA